MPAEFHHPPLLHDGNPIRITSRLQAMRDGDHRPPLQNGGHRPLRVPRRPRVQQRRRLVQHQGVRIGQHHPSQGKLLSLRPVHPVSHGPHLRVESVRQLVDPLQGPHGGEGRPQGVVVGRGAAISRLSRSVPRNT